MFGATSRYAGLPVGTFEGGDGRRFAYVLLRPLPSPPAFQRHIMLPGDRLDLIANRYLGDPEQSWRVCDANLAFDPDSLTAIGGRRLSIPGVT